MPQSGYLVVVIVKVSDRDYTSQKMNRLLPLQRELLNITISFSLYGFASSLVGVFIPLIILQTGAPLAVVAGFYAAYAIIKLVINYPAVMVIRRFGVHVGLACGFLAGALQILATLLYSHSHSLIYLALGAVALALSNAFLWSSQHIYISKMMNRTSKSSSMATMEIMRQVISVAAPLFGGVIATAFGVNWILVVALIIAVTALFPLRGLAALHRVATANEVTPRVKYNLKGAPFRDVVANFSFGIDTSVGVFLWPIYLAVAISTYRGIGTISAISAGAAIVTVWIAGHRGDKGHDRQVLRQGIFGSSAINVLRLFAVTPLNITLLSAGYRATLAYFQNAWTSTYYMHAGERGINYVMSMEIAGDVSGVFLWGLVFVLSLTVTSGVLFNVCFVLAAVVAWGCLLITKQSVRLTD